MLKVKFYGTRGSLPIPNPSFQEFGGNTTCIALMGANFPDTIGIFDAGTGIRNLGKEIVRNGWATSRINIGFSHFHWDHIQGFPFFDPAYTPGQKINILALGKNRKIKNLKDVFSSQMQEAYFPVALDNMGAEFHFMLEDEDELTDFFGSKLSAIYQNHPGGSFGYRIEAKDKVITICTDLEHGPTIRPEIVAFASGSDLLIHEAQYTDEELEEHQGWGHSSFSQALKVAEQAQVKQLIITHHDPDHDDAFLRKQERWCQERFRNCLLAREGMEITV